jgi:hypothetical protein
MEYPGMQADKKEVDESRHNATQSIKGSFTGQTSNFTHPLVFL